MNKRYNITHAAKELGVARQTLYNWIEKGWIKPKKDYRNYPVFTIDDIKKIKKWQVTLNE
ncbi:MAG: MerR family transcriptional regulator [Candidatus Omnitrophota bacterium]